MLKNFCNFFSKKTKLIENNNVEDREVNQDELLETINFTLGGINSLIYKKAEHWSESDLYKCSGEDFQNLVSNLEKEGLSMELSAGQYVIGKTIKKNQSTVYIILKQFKFEEIKNEA